MRHVLSALVQNVPGVLSHISGMLASRGYNIDSLTVGETENPKLSRMTFVVVGDDTVLDQVRNQPGFDPKKYEGTRVWIGYLMLIGDLVP